MELATSELIRTGRAAVGVIGTDLIEDSSRIAGYVRSGSIDDYAGRHFMVSQVNGKDVLYEKTLPIEFEGAEMPTAVVAADLALSTDTRERSAALRALNEMRGRWLAAH